MRAALNFPVCVCGVDITLEFPTLEQKYSHEFINVYIYLIHLYRTTNIGRVNSSKYTKTGELFF